MSRLSGFCSSIRWQPSMIMRALSAAAVCAVGWIGACNGDAGAGGAVPGRDAVAPPELPRDAPVMDVFHPLQVDRLVVLRSEADASVVDHVLRDLGERGPAVPGGLVARS